MQNILLGVLLIAIGSLAVIFNRKYNQMILSFQSLTFGLRFGKLETLISRLVIVIVGSIAVVTGVASLFGLIKWH